MERALNALGKRLDRVAISDVTFDDGALAVGVRHGSSGVFERGTRAATENGVRA